MAKLVERQGPVYTSKSNHRKFIFFILFYLFNLILFIYLFIVHLFIYLSFFFCLFFGGVGWVGGNILKKTSKLYTTGPLWWESIVDWWIPLTKD